MAQKVTIIQNEKGLQLRKTFRELYEYRELLWMLAWRDFRVRYAQTFLGFLWAILEPLATAILLSLVFNKVAKASTFGVEPILFGMTGMVCWNYFANVTSQGNTSLIMAQNMVKKIYFPRMIIPLSKAVAALPDLLITIVFTFILMLFSKNEIHITYWLFPFHVFLTVISAATISLWFSALNIRFRDFKHVVPFLIRLGLFITPIAYSTAEVNSNYKWLFFINPMTGIIEHLRWALFGLSVENNLILISCFSLIVLLFGGVLAFKTMDKNIADIL